jgi:hypothetical protein
MERDDVLPWVGDIDDFIRTFNDEEKLKQIPDPREGPEELVGQKLKNERIVHIVETIWPREDGLSSDRRNRQRKWQQHLKVFQLRLRDIPVETIADQLKCHKSTVYNKMKEIRFLLQYFDVMLIELKDRLADPTTQEVLHRITIGRDTSRISRDLGLEIQVVEVACITLRREFACVMEEFLCSAIYQTKGYYKLLEALRQLS